MDKTRADEYLKAMASAYVWVAGADGCVDHSEFVKFERVVVQSPYATQFEREHVRRYFKDMVAAFSDDFDAAVELTRSRLKPLVCQPHLGEEILRVCRAATIADSKLEPQEEFALTEVARVLALHTEA